MHLKSKFSNQNSSKQKDNNQVTKMTKFEWLFHYKDDKKQMSEEELKAYHQKLLEVREKYEKRALMLTDCHFHQGNEPPSDNIFAWFRYDCRMHTPKCEGWFLLWNPNTDVNKTKINGHHNNHCATFEYKALSKKIQKEIQQAFPEYFEFFDDDDTHGYYTDACYNLNYGFKYEEEEFPDYTSFNPSEQSFYSLSDTHM